MKDLDTYKDENAFRIPDGYFEKMQNDVIQKIHYNQIRYHRNRLIIGLSSIAAGVFIFVGFLVFLPKNGQSVLVSAMDTVSKGNIIQQSNSKIQVNQEFISGDVSKSISNAKQLAASVSVKSATKDNSNENVQQFDNLDYEIVESYSDELVYADIMELYSE